MISEYGWRFDAAASPPRLIPSVRARSSLAAVVVVALALGSGAALLYFVLQRSLLSGLDTAATSTAAAVSDELRSDGADGLDARLKRTAVEGQWVQVVDGSDEVIATSSSRPNPGPITSLRPADGQVLREQAGLFKVLRSKRPFLVLTHGVRDDDGRRFTVIVASFTEVQRKSVQTVLKLLLVGFPVLLVLVGFAIWVLIGRALSPVEQLRQRVAGIGAGQLDERVPIPPTRDEVASLAITMNRMLDRLQAAQQAQRQFVSDASHELRSPLATLTATLEVADADVSGQAWRDLRGVMASEAGRMGTLVENLLLLARADDDGLRIVAVEVDLDDLMEEEARRLRSSSGLLVSTAIEPVRVLGDRLKLSQVLRNLVDNAGRYARTGVRLGLTVTQAGQIAVITVQDDGPGIPQPERERVFERFVRLDESRDRASGGAGLGLPIVREVVRGHGGTVVVEAGADGGCRVLVRLPIRLPIEPPTQPPTQPPVLESR